MKAKQPDKQNYHTWSMTSKGLGITRIEVSLASRAGRLRTPVCAEHKHIAGVQMPQFI